VSQNEKLPALNTDRELWREKPGDYYSDSIHVTEGGGIGLNCGGCVIVMPIRKWHALAEAAQVTPPPSLIDKLNKAKWDFTREERHEVNLMLDAYQKKIASGGETEAAPDSVGSPQTLPLDLISETLHSMFLGDLIMKRLKEVADSVGAAPAAQKEATSLFDFLFSKGCMGDHADVELSGSTFIKLTAEFMAKAPAQSLYEVPPQNVEVIETNLADYARRYFDLFEQYRHAWLREMGGVIRPKRWEIDGFVLRQRDIYEKAKLVDRMKRVMLKSLKQKRTAEEMFDDVFKMLAENGHDKIPTN
jgi:hypothetical protein